MTLLLNGQAVKVWLASTSVTVMLRIEALERAGAARAGKAAAHDDDAAAGVLRDRGCGEADAAAALAAVRLRKSRRFT